MKKQEQGHQKENPIYQEYQLNLNLYNKGKAKLGIELLINTFNVYREHKQEKTALTEALENYSQNAESDLEKLICYEMLSILRKTPELLSDKILPTLESFLKNHSGHLMDIDLKQLKKYFQSIELRDSSLTDHIKPLQKTIHIIPNSIGDKNSTNITHRINQLLEIVGMNEKLTDDEKNSQNIESETLNSFIKRGDWWEISFKGKSTIISNIKGLRYIHELLTKPGEDISCYDLEKTIDISDPEILDAKKISASLKPDSYKKDDGAKQLPTVDREPIIDDQADREIKKKIKDLKYDLEKAQELYDHKKEANIREEINQILKYYNSSRNKYGGKRVFPTGPEKSRQRVLKNITTAQNKIRKRLPALADHLKEYLDTGNDCKYKNQDSIEWELY